MSIRTKFTLGMIFIFLIILVLLGFSAFYLNKLSKKTSAILKENYLSLVYAREITEEISKVNLDFTTAFLENKKTEKQQILKTIEVVSQSLEAEKNNITEPGEDKLVASIEAGFSGYSDSVAKAAGENLSAKQLLYFQQKAEILQQQLVLLSQMNGKAIEMKTDDAKISSKNALTGMTILGSFCFLIALSFIYSFASYFNERFLQLYKGIKEIVSSNYGQRLYFDGVDEFYEISLLFNQMAEKLSGEQTRDSEQLSFLTSAENEEPDDNVEELQDVLIRIKSIEKQAEEILSKIKNNG